MQFGFCSLRRLQMAASKKHCFLTHRIRVGSESLATGECVECIHVQTPPHLEGVITADIYLFYVYVGLLNKLLAAFEGRKRVFALNHLAQPSGPLTVSPWRYYPHRLTPASQAPGDVRRHGPEGSEPGERLSGAEVRASRKRRTRKRKGPPWP